MSRLRQLQNKAGFTLIEILVVVAIIGILSAVVAVNSSGSGKLSRDVERQADLRTLQSAIEMYKNKYGHYPSQCTPDNAVAANGWSGQLTTDYECDNGTGQYIEGLAPEFIRVLPVDPKLNGPNSGYVYRTNESPDPKTDRTVYKLMAMRTVEADIIGYDHEFKSCDWNGGGSADILIAGFCTNYDTVSGNTPTWCKTNDPSNLFQTSYGVWGGFAPLNNNNVVSLDGQSDTAKRNLVINTTNVICSKD